MIKKTSVIIIITFLFFIISCGDIHKLKKENSLLTTQLDTATQTLNKQKLQIEKLNSEQIILKEKASELEALKQVNAKAQSELAVFKLSDQAIYNQATEAYNLAQESLKLEQLQASKDLFAKLLQKFPSSQFGYKSQNYLEQLDKQINIAGPITDGENKIKKALAQHEFNTAYYELKKIRNILSADRFNKNREMIDNAVNTPILFKTYKEFYENSIAGLWIGAKYKVFAKLDNKAKGFCDPEQKEKCSNKQSVKIRNKFKGAKLKSLNKLKNKTGCFEIFMKNKWIYISKFTSTLCN